MKCLIENSANIETDGSDGCYFNKRPKLTFIYLVKC
jgi:hypothetical protein